MARLSNDCRALLKGIGIAPIRYLFGRDIFISYRRQDGIRYAAALAEALASDGYRVVLDQWGSPPGERIPARLARSLQRASCLVVVGSPEAIQSKNVGWEIANFPHDQRPLVPIAFGRSVEQAAWVPLLKGLALEIEPLEALSEGTPSERCRRRIESSVTYARQEIRVTRAFSAAAAALIALICAAGWQVHRATEAIRARTAARAQELSALARAHRDTDPELSVRLAEEALHTDYNVDGDATLRSCMAGSLCLHTLYGHDGPVNSVAYSKDGRFVVSAGDDGTVRIWDATTGALQKTLTLNGEKAFGAGFASNDAYLITSSSSSESATQVWSTSDWHQLWATPEGFSLRAVGQKGQALVENNVLATFQFRALKDGSTDDSFQVRITDHGVRSVVLSPDGKWLAVELETFPASVRLWNLETEEVTDLEAPDGLGELSTLVFSRDGSRLVAADLYKSCAWKLDPVRPAAFAVLRSSPVPVLTTVLDNLEVLMIGRDRAEKWLTWSEGEAEATTVDLQHNGNVWTADVTSDGCYAITGGRADKVAKLWLLTDANPNWESLRMTYSGHTGRINGIAVRPDDRQFATASDDGTVRIWRIDPLELLGSCDSGPLRMDSPPAISRAPNANLNVADSAARERNWRSTIERNACRGQSEADQRKAMWIAFDDAGDRVVVAGAEGKVFLESKDHSSAQHIPVSATESVRYARFSPDGTSIVTDADSIKVWNAESGNLRFELDEPRTFQSPVRFDANGKYAVTSGQATETLQLWEVATGTHVSDLSHATIANAADFGRNEPPRFLRSLG